MVVLIKIAYGSIHLINTEKAHGLQKFYPWATCGPIIYQEVFLSMPKSYKCTQATKVTMQL